MPALLLVLAGCSGGETAPTSAEASAPGSAAGAASASSPAVDVADLDRETLVPTLMEAVEAQRTAHVSMTTSARGQSFTAEGDVAFEGDSQDMAVTMDGASFGVGDIEVRLVDGVLYLAVPPMTPEGKFVAVRPGDQGSPLAGMLDQMGTLDPRETFAAFEKGLREVEYVGRGAVEGEQLHHYRLTVDFRDAAKAQGMPIRPGMPETVVYDMWLDERGLMRRVELEVQGVRTLMEFSQWGEPVTIEAPPAEDIVESPRPAA